ncbi:MULTISPECIES: glycosyltransferase family protein [unclassified Arthrobacter]|uniref:glycosyltransferase family protein n=1 Tax=unclassified Arthrobacter TaxID=235627 RepID=UPI002E147096|nr:MULTISPECIES: glycosyltransferase [unclassified Arthrobacter]
MSWCSRQRTEQGHSAPRNAKGVEAAWTGLGRKRRLSFNPATLPEQEPSRPDVHAAVILDDFSALAFGYEWSTSDVHPHTWRKDLSAAGVDLLFVESAWAGNGGLWRGKLAGPLGPSDELRELVLWCRDQGIPTVFWNKEDPPHYDDFLPAARLFDQVFTSDSGRISQYTEDLGHDRVAVLPFAAQPVLHNPVRPAHGRHSRDVAFAGMYFAHKYPERRAQMDFLLGGVADASARMRTGLEIFSRQLGGNPEYQFPAPLDTRVVGSLSYLQTLSAYKAFKVFLNVNSVVDSPSMCARRIFEITASGTPVVTAPSQAVGHFFTQAAVPIAATRAQAEHITRALVSNAEFNDRTVHLAQRAIWSGHTYAHRADQVLRLAVPDKTVDVGRATVSVLLPTFRPGNIENIFRTLAAQSGVAVELVLLTHGWRLTPDRLAELSTEFGIRSVVLMEASREVSLGECLNRCVAASTGLVLTKMDDDDHYGPHYLSDQLYALSYSGADVVGKQAHYMHLETSNAAILRFAAKEHRFTDFVMGPTIMGRREVFTGQPFEHLSTGEDTSFLRAVHAAGRTIYSSDRFNYFQVRTGAGHTWQVDDAELLASGDVKFYGKLNDHVDI